MLRNLLIVPGTYFSLLRDVRRQKKYVDKVLEPLLAEAEAANDGSLDHEDFDKIRNYYGFGVPAIVGEGICTLRGKEMTVTERLASTFQGALTGLYDDFFDKTGLDHEEIMNMMKDPGGYSASSSLERLFLLFLSKVHDNLPDREFFDHCFGKVFMAQVRSKQQKEAEAGEALVRDITFAKGGYSVLFYRSAFPGPVSPEEENALYHLGGLMQLGNDIFDVYDDSRQGIQTLPILHGDISQVRELFVEKMELALGLVKEIPSAKAHIQDFSRKFVLGISRCFVCLDQLESLQRKTRGVFLPMEYSRDELVCDMEKPANILGSLRYFTGYAS